LLSTPSFGRSEEDEKWYDVSIKDTAARSRWLLGNFVVAGMLLLVDDDAEAWRERSCCGNTSGQSALGIGTSQALVYPIDSTHY
jgi:hypothetical protein